MAEIYKQQRVDSTVKVAGSGLEIYFIRITTCRIARGNGVNEIKKMEIGDWPMLSASKICGNNWWLKPEIPHQAPRIPPIHGEPTAKAYASSASVGED